MDARLSRAGLQQHLSISPRALHESWQLSSSLRCCGRPRAVIKTLQEQAPRCCRCPTLLPKTGGSLAAVGASSGPRAWPWQTASQQGCGCGEELVKHLSPSCNQANLLHSKEDPRELLRLTKCLSFKVALLNYSETCLKI